MLEERILFIVNPVHCWENTESAVVDLLILGLHAWNVVVLDDHLLHQAIRVWLCLDNLAILVHGHRMLAEVLVQETDLSGLNVRTWELTLLVSEEFWKNMDVPLIPPCGNYVLNILLESHRNISCRRCLCDQQRHR